MTMNRRATPCGYPSLHRQKGVYTILVAAILIGVSMLAIRGVTRSAIVETRMASNDVQMKDCLLYTSPSPRDA